jgi:ATP-dependent 26S proteasome regulatory subunit
MSPPADDAATPFPGASDVLLTRDPPASNGAVGSAEVARHLIEDRDRIAQDMNDVVVSRLFAAGLDLHAALGRIGNHSGATNIHHAIGELDQAIKDIRDVIFGPVRKPRPPTRETTIDSPAGERQP